MSNSNYSPRRLQDQLDISGAPSAGTVPVFNALTGKFEFVSMPTPTPPGMPGQFIYNDAGAFGATADATIDGSGDVTFTGNVDADSFTGDGSGLTGISPTLPSNLAYKDSDNLFSAHQTFATDNTYDIGASGAHRPRDGYFGRRVIVGSSQVYDPTFGLGYAGFGHKDFDYSFYVSPGGDTAFNSVPGNNMSFRVGNSVKWLMFPTGAIVTALDVTALVEGTITTHTNLGVGADGSYAGASKVIYLANASALPAGTPSGGGLIVNDNGDLKWYTPLGNVRTLAAA